MEAEELFDWLTSEAIGEDIVKLMQLTAASELDNITENFCLRKYPNRL